MFSGYYNIAVWIAVSGSFILAKFVHPYYIGSSLLRQHLMAIALWTHCFPVWHCEAALTHSVLYAVLYMLTRLIWNALGTRGWTLLSLASSSAESRRKLRDVSSAEICWSEVFLCDSWVKQEHGFGVKLSASQLVTWVWGGPSADEVWLNTGLQSSSA